MTHPDTQNLIDTQVINGSTYSSINVMIKGNIWTVMVVVGIYNYLNVLKVTNNPFGTLGKRFDNLEALVTNYKSPEMHLGILHAIYLINSNFSNN